MPLLTINIHLGGKDCLQACSSSTQQDKKHTSRQHQRDQQTAVPSVTSPAVLQLEPTSSDLPARGLDHAADAVQCAALQPTAGQLLVPATICQASAVAPDDERHQPFHKTAVLLHSPSPAAASSLCNHQLSEVLHASTSGTTELSLVPHAELMGEYRIPDFVTTQEETNIVRVLDAAAPQWKDSAFNGKHRYLQADTSSCVRIQISFTFSPDLIMPAISSTMVVCTTWYRCRHRSKMHVCQLLTLNL